MKSNRLFVIGLIVLLLVSVVSWLPGVVLNAVASNDLAGKVAPQLLSKLEGMREDEVIEVVIRLKSLPREIVSNVRGNYRFAVQALKNWAEYTQRGLVNLILNEGGVVLNKFWLDNVVLAKVPVGLIPKIASLPEVVRIFENFEVRVVEPVVKEEAEVKPGQQVSSWGIFKIRAPEAWALGYTGQGVRIAVLDTGVDITHPALQGKMLTLDPASPYYPGGWMEFDYAGNPILSTPHDTHGHGTHTSGTALGGDTVNILIGVAPGATLMHGLVLPGGGGTFAQVLAGMQWTVEPFYIDPGTGQPVYTGLPAHVVSMSFGASEYYGNDLFPAIEAMLLTNIIPVASIGNGGPGTSGNPGNVWGVFGVGATDINDNVASWSSGRVVTWPSPPPTWPFFDMYPSTYVKPDLSAPGVSIRSSVPGGGYADWSGTSMSCPHVSGTVALILQAAGWLYHDIPDTPEQVYLILNSTAIDFGDPGLDTRYGYGRIDAYEATKKAMEFAKKSGVEGFVLDSLTSEPVPWATVTVVEIGRTFTVNASGYYRIPLDPGTYTLVFEAWGYEPYTATVEVILLNGTITGLVFNALTNEPISGANVTVVELGMTVVTGPDGIYEVSVPPGTYTLEAAAYGYFPRTEVVTVDEAEVVIVDFGLYPLGNGTIAGHVYNAVTNEPISDVLVWTYVDGTPVYNYTDATGYYELSVPSGTYTVYAWKPGYVQASTPGVVVAPAETVIVDFYLQPIPPTVVVLANVHYYTQPHLKTIVEALGLPVTEYNDMTQLLQDWVNGLINPAVVIIDHTMPDRFSYPSFDVVLAFHILADSTGTTLIWLDTSYSGYTGIYVLYEYRSQLISAGYPAPVSRLSAYPSTAYVIVTMLNTTHPIFEGVTPDIPPNKFYLATGSYADYAITNFTDPTGRFVVLAYVNDTRTGYLRHGVGVAEWVSNTGSPWYYLGSWAESYWMQYLEPGYDGMYTDNTKKVLENAVLLGWTNYVSSTRLDKGRLSAVLSIVARSSGKSLETSSGFKSYLYTRLDAYLNRLPHGYVTGTVRGSDGAILAGALVQFIGTPVKVYTNETGQFFTWLPEGNYTASIKMVGYKTVEVSFTVLVNETTDLGLIVLKRLPRVAILYDYAGSIKSFLESMEIYAVDYTDLSALTNDVLAGMYDAVVWAGYYGAPFPTYYEFMSFLNATHTVGVGVVWMDSWGTYGYGIKALQQYLGDPPSVGYAWGYGEVYVRVTGKHPILKGYEVGDLIKIITYTSADFSWFSGFSGTSIADTYVAGSTWGNSIAWKVFPDGVKWALLSSFPPTQWNTPTYFTPDAWKIIYNAIKWVMTKPLTVVLEEPYLHVGDEAILHISEAPANTTLLIYLDGQLIGEVLSDEAGYANFTFTVPLIPGGEHLIEVYTEDEMYYGYTPLYVILKIVVTPTETTAPGLVKINATGLRPYQAVMIYLDGNWLSNYRANALGTFEIKINIPFVVTGEHELNIVDLEKGELLGSTMLTIASRLDDIFAKLDEIGGTITNISGGVIFIKTKLGEIQVSLDTVLTNLGVIDGKLANISGGVVFIKTKLGEIQVSLSDLMNALMSVNASLTQVVITSKGEVLGVISTSKGEILASVNVVKELIEAGLPVDTQTLLNTLTSLINEKSASIMNKLDEILQAVRGVRDTMASKTDVSDLSSKVDTIGQKIDSSSGTLSTYGAVTVGLIIVTLIASIYGFFIKKK
ncbi:MAG: carboxypeptidase regulatory-like domain-containing protein [Zestosphaera sp.]